MTERVTTGMNRRLIALTHASSPRMNAAVRTFIDVEPIDLGRVERQHVAYRRALEHAGAKVVVLDVNVEHPDAVFIEDAAVVLDEIAVVASMGTPSRCAEVHGIERELRHHRNVVRRIEPPATLEGGDVLRAFRTLYVGLGGRTNEAGADALGRITEPYGYEVRRVCVTGCLHLKTACTALPDGRLLVNSEWLEMQDLAGVPLLHVDDAEPDAANVVLVGDRIIMTAAHPRTVAQVRARGFHVDTVDLSELAKAEGSATCLSLVFAG